MHAFASWLLADPRLRLLQSAAADAADAYGESAEAAGERLAMLTYAT